MEAASEVIKVICSAVEAGNFAALGALMADDGVFRGTVGGIDERAVMSSGDDVVRYFTEVADTWDEWRFEVEEVHGEDDRWVIFWRETSRSRELEMVNQTATAFLIRDGRVVEGRGYLDRAAALEAMGLA